MTLRLEKLGNDDFEIDKKFNDIENILDEIQKMIKDVYVVFPYEEINNNLISIKELVKSIYEKI